MNQEIPAGWYPDPAGTGGWRWWDGQRWTEHVHTPASAKGRGPRTALAAGGVLALVFVAVAVVAAVNIDGGASVEVLGGDSPTTEIHRFGGTALPQMTLELPQETWEQRLDGSPLDVETLDETAYVMTGTFGTDGFEGLQLKAIDTASGEPEWRHEVSGNSGAAVIAAGDESLLLRAGNGEHYGETIEPAITALTRDGEQLWTESFVDGIPYPHLLPGPRLLLQDYAQDPPRSRILDLTSGETIRELDGTLVARDDRWSLVRRNDEIAVIDAEGNEPWSRRSDSYPTTALGDGLVYLVDNGRLLALAVDSGEQRWSVNLRLENAYHALRVPNQGVIVRGSDEIEAFDLDGERLWDRSGGGSLTLLERGSEQVLLRVNDEAHTEERAEIELLEASTGRRLEHRVLGEQAFVYNQEGAAMTRPLTADAVLVRDRGNVSAIAYEGLEERWTIASSEGRVSGAVAIPGGALSVRRGDESVILVAYR